MGKTRAKYCANGAVKELRAQKGWTQRELARQARVSLRTVTAIETGVSVGIWSLRSVAGALRVELPIILVIEPAPGLVSNTSYSPNLVLSGNRDLLGRESILQNLAQAFYQTNVSLVVLVGPAGNGKTAIVQRFLESGHSVKQYAFQFNSSGRRPAGNPEGSIEFFLQCALRQVNRPDALQFDLHSQVQCLVNVWQTEPWLVVADGLESIQDANGDITEPHLRCLLDNLSMRSAGLTIVTTHVKPQGLASDNRVLVLELGTLQPSDSVRLLARLIPGQINDQLGFVAEKCGHHPLTLTIVGTYLRDTYDGSPCALSNACPIEADEALGSPCIQALDAHLSWYRHNNRRVELSLLYALALFDRPVERDCLMALRDGPPVVGLTDSLSLASHREFINALNRLSRARLIETEVSKHSRIDCHALIRNHLAVRLEKEMPRAAKKCHRILFNYLEAETKQEEPSAESMTRLYSAIGHACRAGLGVQAYRGTYKRRIRKEGPRLATDGLGMFDVDGDALKSVLNCSSKGVRLSQAERANSW